MNPRHRVPFFELVVYSQPLSPFELKFIHRWYKDFLKFEKTKLEDFEARGPWAYMAEDILIETKDQVGAHVVAQVLKDGVQRLQIRSYVPYADPDELIRIIKRAVDKHKMGVTGTSSVFGGVRTWCVHLLTEECKLSNRDAIKLWNEELGNPADTHTRWWTPRIINRSFVSPVPGSPNSPRKRKCLRKESTIIRKY